MFRTFANAIQFNDEIEQKMKWTVLSDNRTIDCLLETTEQRELSSACMSYAEAQGRKNEFQTEHGLSILLETDKHRILLDTGASDVLICNAEKMGIDLKMVDYVFISHGHSDHAGGLKHLMALNDKAKVIVSPHAMSGKFFSKRGNLHGITAEWPEIDVDRLVLINQTCEIAEGILAIAHIPQIHPIPKGNQNLYVQNTHGNYIHDDFRHELALYVDGLLFTGCAHSGLGNILTACSWPVHTVVGGFHLLDGQETEEELAVLAQSLKAEYPRTQFYTSHCTGDGVYKIMKSVMGGQLQSFRCGTVIELTNRVNNEPVII